MKAIKHITILLFALLFSLSLNAQTEVKIKNAQDTELELAQQYYEKEEYEKALSYLEKIPRKHSSTAVYELFLNCYLALEDYREAEDHIEGYVKSGVGNKGNYYADLLYVYLQQEKINKADKLVSEMLAEVEKNPGLAYGYANSLQLKGYPKIALEVYETAEKRMPNANFDYQKALLYGELGDIKKMYATYVEMVESSPTYLGSVKQLLARAIQEESSLENSDFLKGILIEKIQKGGPQTLNDLLVFIFIQEKNFSGAFIQLKALEKRNSGSTAPIFHLGRVALNNDEYALAERIFDYIIKVGEESTYYEQALGASLEAKRLHLIHDNQDDIQLWQDLQKDYFKVIKQLRGLPDVGPLTINLADITAFKLNETDTAVGMLHDLISRGYISESDVALAKIKLGDILLYKGNRWEAIIYYGQAEKAFEQSPIGQEAKFKRAKAAYYVGDFKWAEGIFNVLKESTSKLIANDAMRYSLLINDNIAMDTNTEAMEMYARADLMNYQGKKDSALVVLSMMDIAFPGHVIQDDVLFLKGKILSEQRKYEEAARSYATLVELYSSDILADDATYALAELYLHHLQKTPEAMDLYQKIFTEHPDSFFATEARKKFRELRGDVIN